MSPLSLFICNPYLQCPYLTRSLQRIPFRTTIASLTLNLFFMGDAGTCSVCGAEEIDINEDEMCSDCAKNDGVDFKGADENPLDMGIEEDEM